MMCLVYPSFGSLDPLPFMQVALLSKKNKNRHDFTNVHLYVQYIPGS